MKLRNRLVIYATAFMMSCGYSFEQSEPNTGNDDQQAQIDDSQIDEPNFSETGCDDFVQGNMSRLEYLNERVSCYTVMGGTEEEQLQAMTDMFNHIESLSRSPTLCEYVRSISIFARRLPESSDLINRTREYDHQCRFGDFK